MGTILLKENLSLLPLHISLTLSLTTTQKLSPEILLPSKADTTYCLVLQGAGLSSPEQVSKMDWSSGQDS